MFEAQDPPLDLLELGDRIQFAHVLINHRLVKRSIRSIKKYAGKLISVAGGHFEGQKVV